MKNRKILFAALLAAFISGPASTTAAAQSNTLFQFDSFTNPSIETFSMEKYGAVSSNLNTGAMAYSLPIYHYSDPDFDIPVSLEYNFGGYQPSMHSGLVGLGWYLNCGGCITREVRGLPDESARGNQHGQYGFWHTCHEESDCNRTQIVDAFSFQPWNIECELDPGQFNIFSQTPMYPNSHYAGQYTSVQRRYDISPDIFHFSCAGGHGDFCLTDDGSVAVFNTDSPFGEVEVSMSVDNSERFCIDISFGDGYVYKFGYQPSCYEYSSSFPSDADDGFDPESWSRTMTSLRLYRIVAPNGRTVTFHYADRWQVQATGSVSYSSSFQWLGLSEWNGATQYSDSVPSKRLPTLSCAYTCPLESVEIDGSNLITFSYSDKDYDEFRTDSFLEIRLKSLVGDSNITDQCGLSAQAKVLSAITVRNRGGRLIEKAELSHIYTSHSSCTPKMLLTGVSLHTTGDYTFDYNADTNSVFPRMDTQGVDHWGYWNGSGEYDMRTVTMVDIMSCRSLYEQFPSFSGRDPNWNYSSRGALTGITYPTGGRTVVEYEPHKVGRRIEQRYGGGLGLVSLSEDYTVGGVRVKTITNYTDDSSASIAERKSYTYLRPSGDGISSGELLHMPRYGMSLRYHHQTSEYDFDVQAHMYTKECMPGLSRSPHVCYADVQEHALDSSWVAYRFISYNDRPDVYYDCYRYDVQVYKPSYLQYDSWCNESTLTEYGHLNVVNLLMRAASIDNSGIRGKLIGTVVHASNGNILSSEENIYTIVPVDTVRIGQNELFALTSFPFFCRTAQLVTTKSRTYGEGGEPQSGTDMPGNCISVTNEYSYNGCGQPCKVETFRTGSSEGRDILYYRYCHECPPSSGNSRYRGAVSDMVRTRVSGGQEYVTASEHITYNGSGYNPQPSSITRYLIEEPVLLTSDGSTFTAGRTYNALTSTFFYDNRFRVIRERPSGDLYTEYTWDSYGIHPLSRTENFGRNTTSYEWLDMVGLTKITYPSGICEDYSYDYKGRLSSVYDQDGNPVKEYGYHLRRNYVRTDTYSEPYGDGYYTDYEYYDGLGYPCQSIAVDAVTGGRNLITPHVYDCMRRDNAMQYLPYSRQASPGSSLFVDDPVPELEAFYQDLYGSSETCPYIRRQFEDSHSGRVLSERKPGHVYADSGKAVVNHYRPNDADGGDDIKVLTFVGNGGVLFHVGGVWDGCSLIATTTVDEDGAQAIRYEDWKGRLICSRSVSPDGAETLDTYYVYDLKDQLVCVVQPEGSHSLAEDTDVAASGDLASRWCFRYWYDGEGRVVRKHVPGGGYTVYAYDYNGRLTLEADSGLSGEGVFRYTEYTSTGQISAQGLCTLSDDLDSIRQCLYEGEDIYDWFDDYTNMTAIQYYPLTGSYSIPAGYGFVADEVATSSDLDNGQRNRLMKMFEETWDCPTFENASEWQGSVWRKQAFYYNGKGRLIQTVEKTSDGWTNITSVKYDFVGNVLSRLEKHTTPGGSTNSLRTDYTYDARGRVLSCARTLDGETLDTVEYAYDALGRMVSKSVGGKVAESYEYDIRGWAKAITASRDTSILFSEAIHFEDPQMPGTTALYSGNISEIETVQYGKTTDIYAYSYDGFSRLSDARHFIGGASGASNTNTERLMEYDLNGNLTSIQRYGATPSDCSTIMLSYTGNRLTGATKIRQRIMSGYSFAYDLNGNRTLDSRTGLEFTHNLLNLPCEVRDSQDNMRLRYTYLSDGTKISALDAAGDGLLYRGSFVYDRNGSNVNLESVAWDEGRISAQPFQDQWFVRDHLGNVRSVIDLTRSAAMPADSVILEQNDYLPYGTKVSDASLQTLSGNRYRYAGKEEQRFGTFDSQLLDFGARYYDPWTCQWTAADPMAEKYAGMTPYGYCAGSPIRFADPNGTDLKDRLAAISLGLITNVVPGTGMLRDEFTPNDKSEYNETLQKVDKAFLVAGGALFAKGATDLNAGATVTMTGVALAATGVGAVPGMEVAVAGGTIDAAGIVEIAAGATMAKNAMGNSAQGYNRGKDGGQNSSERKLSGNGKNEPHGNMAAKEKMDKRNESLKEKLIGATKKERYKIQRKIRNNERIGEKNAKGETHHR